MEHAIGTEITLPDGRKAKVVEIKSPNCIGCIMQYPPQCARLKDKGLLGFCLYATRTDRKNIIYKEVKEE